MKVLTASCHSQVSFSIAVVAGLEKDKAKSVQYLRTISSLMTDEKDKSGTQYADLIVKVRPSTSCSDKLGSLARC